jgi:hypothetical protein
VRGGRRHPDRAAAPAGATSARRHARRRAIAVDLRRRERARPRSLAALRRRYDAVNIKLDKTGGLTEALAMAVRPSGWALPSMVGLHGGGRRLAMAPANAGGATRRVRRTSTVRCCWRMIAPTALNYDGSLVHPPLPAPVGMMPTGGSSRMITRRLVPRLNGLGVGVVRHCRQRHRRNPDKPIKMIVPFPPGGPIDTMGRLIAQHLTSALGQQVVIDNRPGAGSTLGTKAAATADADGYTLLFRLVGLARGGAGALCPAFDLSIRARPSRRSPPMALLPHVFVVSPTVPAKDGRGNSSRTPRPIPAG